MLPAGLYFISVSCILLAVMHGTIFPSCFLYLNEFIQGDGVEGRNHSISALESVYYYYNGA